MHAIKAESLTRSFGTLTAVDNLTLTVEEGEIFGLVGPDGAGKTTPVRLLTSILPPTSGDAWVAGHHVVKEAEAFMEHSGYMSQKFWLYEALTVKENIDFYSGIYRIPPEKRRSARNG